MKLEEVYEFMNNFEVVSMATMEGDQPRVRIMALLSHNNKYWCCTIASRSKMEQLKKNNKFEFCNIIRNDENLGSIRAKGKAQIIKDIKVKKELSKAIPFFHGYWKDHTDPEFGLIRLDINKIEVQSPIDKEFYTFDTREEIQIN